jgi:hypothetical protein
MRISFSPQQYRLAVDAAIAVSENKAKLNAAGEVVNRRVDSSRSDFELNLVGTLGEAAVCTAFGVPFEMVVKRFGDGGSDLMVNGYSLQVKTRIKQYPQTYLFVKDMDKNNADVFVSCVMDGPATVDIVGAISREKFERCAVPMNFGYGVMPCVETGLLTDIQSTKEILYSSANKS